MCSLQRQRSFWVGPWPFVHLRLVLENILRICITDVGANSGRVTIRNRRPLGVKAAYGERQRSGWLQCRSGRGVRRRFRCATIDYCTLSSCARCQLIRDTTCRCASAGAIPTNLLAVACAAEVSCLICVLTHPLVFVCMAAVQKWKWGSYLPKYRLTFFKIIAFPKFILSAGDVYVNLRWLSQ
jgi:hypothetical protein